MTEKKPVGIRLDGETRKQIDDLAHLWRMGTRYTAAVIARCVERVWQQEHKASANLRRALQGLIDSEQAQEGEA